ncbi:MAG TPA: hypothetical protein VNX47_02505 [Nevskia sp.]|jgi:hypothetical protein|nr:hypothetical protein [Nevskia sp.]
MRFLRRHLEWVLIGAALLFAIAGFILAHFVERYASCCPGM